MALPCIAPAASLIVWQQYKTFDDVGSFVSWRYKACEMHLKVKYFATDKGKSFSYSFYRSRDEPFIHICKIPHIIYFQMIFLRSSLIQFFNVWFKSSSLLRQIWCSEMLFKVVSRNLGWKIFFLAQPWWATMPVSHLSLLEKLLNCF